MKVVQVNHAFDARLPSASALLDRYHTLTGWSEACVSAGLSVGVVQAFTANEVLHRGSVDYVFCRSAGSNRGVRDLAAAAAACEPDVVHVNGLDAPTVVRALRRALPCQVPIVVQDHAGVTARRFSPRALLGRRSLRLADGYLFTTRAQAQPWIESGVIAGQEQVHVVLESSTSVQPLDAAQARSRTGIDGAPAVLWVGRLDANKDPLTVLAGFERALDVLPAATLTMLFTAEGLRADVEQRVSASAPLRTRVRLVGAVPYDEMAAWYSAADLFVLGSHAEAAGYALLEACACGATPVVSDIAPFRAITGDGAIGRLWPVGDADACAAALRSAADATGARARTAVRHHFAEHLSWNAVGQRARRIYEMVHAARARGRRAEFA